MTEFQAGDIVKCIHVWSEADAAMGRFYRVLGAHEGFSSDLRLQGVAPSCASERFRLAFRPPAGEVWEPWNGGAPPVPADVEVQWVTRVNRGETDQRRPAGSLEWASGQQGYDIIAYRVIPERAAAADKAVEAMRDLPPEATRLAPLETCFINGHRHEWDGGRWVKAGGDPARATIAEAEACMADPAPESVFTTTPGIRRAPLEFGEVQIYPRPRYPLYCGAVDINAPDAPPAPIDPDKIKQGDEVTVRAKVLRVEGGRVHVLMSSSEDHHLWNSVNIDPSYILTHTPKAKPLEAGDRVYADGVMYTGTIKAVVGSRAWVSWDNLVDQVHELASLTRSKDPS